MHSVWVNKLDDDLLQVETRIFVSNFCTMLNGIYAHFVKALLIYCCV
jgi:hypothetical protein